MQNQTSIRRWVFVLSLLAVVAGCGMPTSGDMHGHLLAPGTEMPAIGAEGWINGPGPTAEDLRDHVVVVDVWAYWCGPCRAAMPEMVAAYDKYKEQGVRFIGLTAEGADKLAETQSVVDNAKLPYPNAYGAEGTIDALGVEAIPTVFVVGKNGRIVWHNDRPGTVDEAIESALTKG